MQTTNNKLNLKWVTETIGDSYKQWLKGDSILINSQTGTGKSQFIKNVLTPYISKTNQTLLYIYNRDSLGIQTKDDLQVEIIRNHVYALSYQTITEYLENKEYNIPNYNDYSFIYTVDYIIFDEFHYILQDATFNKKTRIFLEKFFIKQRDNEVSIYMSATAENVRGVVEKMSIRKPIEYTTGIDYSYITPYYFNKMDDIINTINNDTSDSRWLLFINNIKKGIGLMDQIDDSKFICSKHNKKYFDKYVDEVELNNITKNSRFNCKCLIATKSLDNGINLKDPKLTNIVVLTLDKIDFIQMLGRKRIDIENPQSVNLYIMQRNICPFIAIMNTRIAPRNKLLDLYITDKNFFNKECDGDLHKLGKFSDLFYKDKDTGEWAINKASHGMLWHQTKFIKKMINRFKYDKDANAFIKEQLEWINLKYNESNFITDVSSDDDKKTLEEYLESLIGEKLFSEEQEKITKMIMNSLITAGNKIDYRTKKIKPSTLEIILRNELNLGYSISKSKCEQSKKSNNYNKRYIVISKIKN